MLAGLPLGAALFWWSQMVYGDEALEGPFPPVQEDDDNEGDPHRDGCGCPDCSPSLTAWTEDDAETL